MTIRETLLDVVARRAGQIFLVDPVTGREITYGEFHRLACSLAADLRRRGVQKGDRVAVMLPNCCELLLRLHLSRSRHRPYQSVAEQGRHPIHPGQLSALTHCSQRNRCGRNPALSLEYPALGDSAGSDQRLARSRSN